MSSRTATPAHPQSRRDFLRTTLVAGAAAVLASDSIIAANAEPAPTTATSEAKGYRVTPHIRDYYRTAAL